MQASDGCGGTVLSGRRGERETGTGDGRRREAGVDVFVDVGRLDVRNTSKYSVQVLCTSRGSVQFICTNEDEL
jgi:hypothetical protein